MPYYQAGATNGYTKFYNIENDPDRANQYIVSDGYLGSLLTAFRQAYSNAGGPDYEDTDSILLDYLAGEGVTDTGQAANLGRQQAAADKAAGQDVHPLSLAPGGAIPVTAPIGTPVFTPPAIQTAMPERSDAEVYATFQRSAGVMPSNANSGPVAPGGYASFPQLSGYTNEGGGSLGGFSLFGLDMTTLLILAAIGVGAYLLLKKG